MGAIFIGGGLWPIKRWKNFLPLMIPYGSLREERVLIRGIDSMYF
jgi:hypothetical protein